MQFPTDDEQFARVSPNLLDDMKRFGLCVVQLLQTPDEIADAVQACYQHFGVTHDSVTWETENFPDPRSPFLSSSFAADPVAHATREKARPYYATLFGCNPAELCHVSDFYGFRRGTVFETHSVPAWRTTPLKLHWDVDVQAYVRGPARYQGLVALNDNTHDTGSFACVPGSALALPDWVAGGNLPDQRKYVPVSDPWQRQVQRLPLRAGHMVIWDCGTAHRNFVNYSCQPRMVQFCRMVPNSIRHLETHQDRVEPCVSNRKSNPRKPRRSARS